MRKSQVLDLQFPLTGLNENNAYRRQTPGSSLNVLNMRAYDWRTGRSRGGQRPGLTKYLATRVSTPTQVQELLVVTLITTILPPAQNQFGLRSVKGVAVANGDIRVFTSAGFTTPTLGTGALSASAPVIFAAPLFSNVYFADGINDKYLNMSTNTVGTWTTLHGVMPTDAGNRPRLIELWRGRIVVSGIKSDPQNWFMSKVNDATDFDYSPATETETQAVSGNSSPAGKIGDSVKCMIPYSDDLLIFGCDHTIWQMTGDPQAGGRLDMISDITGIAWGRPWCKSPDGVIYFFGSRGGVYKMQPGQAPQRMSAKTIEGRLATVNLDTSIVRMVWNDRQIGFHLFITPFNVNQTTTHYFYDTRNDAWWPDRYFKPGMSPVSVLTFDGDSSDDRSVLMGCLDGFIRQQSLTATADDGEVIESYAWFGPIQLEAGTTPFVLRELQVTIADLSSTVTAEVYAGDSAEDAISQNRVTGLGDLILENAGPGTNFLLHETAGTVIALEGINVDYRGTFGPRRSYTINPRIRACAAYVKLGVNALNNWWAFEEMQGVVSQLEESRKRRN